MLQNIFVALIKFYQRFLSPFFPSCCRYHPTCSQYCIEALQKYGVLKGTLLGIKRILRCTPFHEGGFDYLK